MDSIWSKRADVPSKPTLDKNINTNVLIIGAGMAGVLCAYKLHKAGVPYAVVEQDKICSKVT